MKNPIEALKEPLSTHKYPGPLPPHNSDWTTESLIRHNYIDLDDRSTVKPFSYEVILTLRAQSNHAVVITLRDETQTEIKLQVDGAEEIHPDIGTLATRLRELHAAPINKGKLAKTIKGFRKKICEMLWQTAGDMSFMDL